MIATLNVCTTVTVSPLHSIITFVTRSKTNMAIHQRLCGGGAHGRHGQSNGGDRGQGQAGKGGRGRGDTQ